MSNNVNSSSLQSTTAINATTTGTANTGQKVAKTTPIVQKNLRDLNLIPDGDRYQAIVKRFAGSFGFATIQDGPHAGVDVLVHQNALITTEDGVYRKLAPGDYIECMVTQQQPRNTATDTTDTTSSQETEVANVSGSVQDRLCATYVTGPNAGLLRCEILHQNMSHQQHHKPGRKYPVKHVVSGQQATGHQTHGRGRGGFGRGRGQQHWNARPVVVHNHYHGITPDMVSASGTAATNATNDSK